MLAPAPANALKNARLFIAEEIERFPELTALLAPALQAIEDAEERLSRLAAAERDAEPRRRA